MTEYTNKQTKKRILFQLVGKKMFLILISLTGWTQRTTTEIKNNKKYIDMHFFKLIKMTKTATVLKLYN